MRKKQNAYRLGSKTVFVDVTYVENHKESTKKINEVILSRSWDTGSICKHLFISTY